MSGNRGGDGEEPILGRPPAKQDLRWLTLMDEARKGSLAAIDEAAKQLIGLDGLISGIYFGAVALSNLPAAIAAMAVNRVIFLAPVALWLASLVAAVLVLTPKTYSYNPNSPEEARDTYLAIVATKHGRLKVALGLFVASIVALAFALWMYLNLVP